MRRSLVKLPNAVIGRAISPAVSSTAFSTSSGGGRGRGLPTNFSFTVEDAGQPERGSETESQPPLGPGQGRGLGKPPPPSPVLPSFTSFVNDNAAGVGRGRGRVGGPADSTPQSVLPPQQSKPEQRQQNIGKPISFLKEEDHGSVEPRPRTSQEKNLPSNIVDVLSGAGRGKPAKPMVESAEKPAQENRHIRPRQTRQASRPSLEDGAEEKSERKKILSREEAVKKAVGILSKGGDGGGGGRGRGMDRGGRRGRGGRGRGDFRRGRGREISYEDESDKDEGLLFADDDGDEGAQDREKLAKKFSPEVMNTLDEGLEEMLSRVLPTPVDEAYVDALQTNFLIECEPEYLMEEFGTNPDIDEEPPIPLRDALEKMKPFLMAYEGIQSQEEWEAIIEETMKTVPLMKEIIDQCSGPDRITAKEQQQELERIAKTLPEKVPDSVKQFTDRALLTLQSNPGWKFNKKCQFMDKLVWEVCQHYK